MTETCNEKYERYAYIFHLHNIKYSIFSGNIFHYNAKEKYKECESVLSEAKNNGKKSHTPPRTQIHKKCVG